MKFTTMFNPSKSSVYSEKKIWARKYEIYNHVYSEQVKCLFKIQKKIWARKYEMYNHVYSPIL